MLLFDRTIIVTITTSTGSIEIKDLRIAFNITKTIKATKNEMILEIYNLSRDTRSQLEEVGVKIIVQAGYDSIPETVFIGDVTSVIHPRRGADIVTKIECSDGSVALKETVTSESFTPGTSVKEVVDKLTKSFGLPLKEISEGLEEQFANGISIVGLAKDAMDQLADSFNFDWSVQDGEIQVLSKADTSIDEEILLTPDTGLLGIPEKLFSNISKLPNDPNNKVIGVKAKALLQPKFRPGRKIRVESSLLKGSYKIESVIHRGDTHGSEWISQLEGVAA